MDLLPTFAELADIQLAADRPLDGISVADVLLAGKPLAPRQVFFGYEPKLGTAMRDGDWKMIVKEDQVRLFHLSDDLGERNNRVGEYPDRAAMMRSAIERWKQETTPTPTSHVPKAIP